MTAAALVVLAFLSPAASAEAPNEITFYAGKTALSVKAGGLKVSAPGSSYGLRYLREANPVVEYGVDADFTHATPKDASAAEFSETFQADSTSLLGVVKIGAKDENVQPSLLLGLGAHMTSIRLDAQPKPGFIWTDTGTAEKRTVIDSSGTGWAVKIQAGADYALTDNFLAGGFLAWNYIGDAWYGRTARFAGRDRGSMTAVTFGLDLTGRF
jgi:hypothetical protein